MKIKRNTMIVLLIFFCFLIVATFFDLEISNALYNKDSSFANFFRNYGELPAFIFLALALSIINFELEKSINKYVKVISQIILICINAFLFRRFVLVDHQLIKTIICLVFSTLFVILIYMFLKSQNKNTINELIKIAIMIVIIVLVSNAIVQFLKFTFGRVRYRDLLDDYTSWYMINGYTGNKSFPSGHTVAASNIFCIFMFYECLKIKRAHQIIITILSTLFVILTALSRIVLGAHYLSDVMIGGGIGGLTLLIGMNFTRGRLFMKKHDIK